MRGKKKKQKVAGDTRRTHLPKGRETWKKIPEMRKAQRRCPVESHWRGGQRRWWGLDVAAAALSSEHSDGRSEEWEREREEKQE